jgi:hypothetical protein
LDGLFFGLIVVHRGEAPDARARTRWVHRDDTDRDLRRAARAAFVGRAAGWYGPADSAGYLIVDPGRAIVLLALYRMVAGRRTVL